MAKVTKKLEQSKEGKQKSPMKLGLSFAIGIATIFIIVAALSILSINNAKPSTTTLSTSTTTISAHTSFLGANQLNSIFPVAPIKIWNGTANTPAYVYLAENISLQSEGYMNATTIGNCDGWKPCIGMLFFPFNETPPVCFWMHDTIMPLKQVWFNLNGTISAMANATPETDTPICHNGVAVLETSINQSITSSYRLVPVNSTG